MSAHVVVVEAGHIRDMACLDAPKVSAHRRSTSFLCKAVAAQMSRRCLPMLLDLGGAGKSRLVVHPRRRKKLKIQRLGCLAADEEKVLPGPRRGSSCLIFSCSRREGL